MTSPWMHAQSDTLLIIAKSIYTNIEVEKFANIISFLISIKKYLLEKEEISYFIFIINLYSLYKSKILFFGLNRFYFCTFLPIRVIHQSNLNSQI